MRHVLHIGEDEEDESIYNNMTIHEYVLNKRHQQSTHNLRHTQQYDSNEQKQRHNNTNIHKHALNNKNNNEQQQPKKTQLKDEGEEE